MNGVIDCNLRARNMMYYRSIQSLAAASSIEENTVPNVQPTTFINYRRGFSFGGESLGSVR